MEQQFSFQMENYDEKAPFTSFLPGLAGREGIPIWCFYVNRGQGICSFGIDDKAHAIMEFQPAVRAYEDTELSGFRSFLRINEENSSEVANVEPFSVDEKRFVKTMDISENLLQIEARSEGLGLVYRVKYFVLPNEKMGALVRRVEIENISDKTYSIEGLDGMPKLIPYGILNHDYLAIMNLLRSFVEVRNMENSMPFFSLRSSTADESRVEMIDGGIFVHAIVDGIITPAFYDRWKVFGEWGSMRSPREFYAKGLQGIMEAEQILENKYPCAFVPFQKLLTPADKIRIDQMIGYADHITMLNEKLDEENWGSHDFYEQKEEVAKKITNDILQDVYMESAVPSFDKYIRQSYLDNLLRGGYPNKIALEDQDVFLHLFSRKHGDPERDYNFFATAAEPWSQGNGNFRDVLQNRRNDVYFQPEVGIYNLESFANLVQADGYNPLEVQGTKFRVKESKRNQWETWLDSHAKEQKNLLYDMGVEGFTLGSVLKRVALDEGQIKDLLQLTEPLALAVHKEGYWTDHWVYLLDLLEGVEKLFPDRLGEIVFDNEKTTFYHSAYYVKPRGERYTYSETEEAWRQYDSVGLDEELANELGEYGGHLKQENGEVLRTSIFGKLFLLAVNKFTSLDSLGAGIEMEADKPGWNDALNGLPGIFGSNVADSIELVRLFKHLARYGEKKVFADKEVLLPEAFAKLLLALKSAHSEYATGTNKEALHSYWVKRNELKEEYRDQIRRVCTGERQPFPVSKLAAMASTFADYVASGVKRAEALVGEYIPTYLYFTVNGEFESFDPVPLTQFLEATAKAIKIADHDEAMQLYERTNKSELFDEELGMYKTCGSLDDESFQIGRVRTFTPGWFERESIFTHMHYKFLYSLQLAGLYDTFFMEIQRGLMPFYDAEKYGRSNLEVCSFIASSVNPDPSVRGRGFVSRLSGATAEALSMWVHMMIGEDAFAYENNTLTFRFAPKIAGFFFPEDGPLSFRLFSSITVRYHNPNRKNTYESEKDSVKVERIEFMLDDEAKVITGDQLEGDLAYALREARIKELDVYLS